MIPCTKWTQRWRRVGRGRSSVERGGRRREQRVVWVGQNGSRVCGGEARVGPQVLQQLVGRGEPFATVTLARHPVADVGSISAHTAGITQRGRRHGAEWRRHGHREAVLLVVALGAAARAASATHHQLRVVHTVRTVGTVRVLAHRHQRLGARWRFHPGVTQVGTTGWRAGRVAEQRSRGCGLLMRKGRGSRVGRSECRIVHHVWRTTKRISGVESSHTGFVSRVLALSQHLHAGAHYGTGSAAHRRRRAALIPIGGRFAVRRTRAVGPGRDGLAARRRADTRRLFVGGVVTCTNTLLATCTMYTGLGRRPSLVTTTCTLFRHHIRFVGFKR